jgi:UDP-perosamine 4-acetyltransferase
MYSGNLIFGSGAQAVYVLDNLGSRGGGKPVAFVDIENRDPNQADLYGVPVLGLLEVLSTISPSMVSVIVAHGDNRLKMRIARLLRIKKFRFFKAVHERSNISPLAIIEEGVIVNAGATICAGTKIGANSIIHSGATIDHDCCIKEGCNIAPGASLAGRVYVGKGSSLYTNSCVAPKTRIGEYSVVGAGAVLLRDIPPHSRYAGNPARPITPRADN